MTPAELAILLGLFDAGLRRYEEIWFDHNPGRFHPLYRGLLGQSRLRDRVHLFTHLREIAPEEGVKGW